VPGSAGGLYGVGRIRPGWPIGAVLSFILVTAMLALGAVSNLLVPRRYRR
jgi:hypothetical protein